MDSISTLREPIFIDKETGTSQFDYNKNVILTDRKENKK